MEAHDFKAAWERDDDVLHLFTSEEIGHARTSSVAEHFLTTVGLPLAAAPCLSFGEQSLDWPPEEARQGYLPIGSDGAGNPIVVDSDGTVLLLDHDGRFAPSYVNSDIPTLAEVLLKYRDLIDDAATAPDFDGELSAILRERFAVFLEKLDPRCLQENRMWSGELQLR
ncbi:SUKH-4 family immunity protein [Sphingopyxis sp.]|jgi:hypothetical protein|uniref:SUKH-4 family immunity protein n=1 Tax=Sphingopyxis sp. TaxID=1908224 RepID=UPI00311E8341